MISDNNKTKEFIFKRNSSNDRVENFVKNYYAENNLKLPQEWVYIV